jgi:aminoglycoside phosphotransferase (APT) family kinase protein
MSGPKMHADEVVTDAPLVRRLLAAQHPQWAHLPVVPVASSGTDNALYRIGDELVARLPRIHWAVEQAGKERAWLPRLAPWLPFDVPVPIAAGAPGLGYPWSWSVCRWLEGDNPSPDESLEFARLAADLARFVAALHRIDPAGGPPPGPHNVHRGEPLADRDELTRHALDALGGIIDTDAVAAAWAAALAADVSTEPPVWVHGDLAAGNLLCVEGRLSAVIDFGCLGVGDPACDLMAAWNLLSPAAREVFRDELEVDDATWARGRGWALSVALVQLPYYLPTSPAIAAGSRHTIAQVLADLG